jgi:predicted glycosyltransferase
MTATLGMELARRRPEATVVLACGAERVGPLVAGAPANLAVLTLPVVRQGRLYVGLPGPRTAGGAGTVRSGRGGSLWTIRADILDAALAAVAPDLVYVDHAPTGIAGELLRSLRGWRGAARRPRLALGLLDVLDTPEGVAKTWARNDASAALGRDYDAVLLFGDRRVFDPVVEYGFSPAAAAKCRWCGYLTAPPPAIDRAANRARVGGTARPFVVVTTGGGADGAAIHRAAIEALRGGLLPDVVMLLVTGPLLPAGDGAELLRATEGLPGITLRPFVEDLPAVLAAADAVVAMAGYNTVAELLAAGRRPILIPRVRPMAEQLVRAQRLAGLDSAVLLHPDDLSPARLAAAIRSELAREVSPAHELALDGLTAGADALEELLATRAGDGRGSFAPRQGS